ncbi:MAG: polysulfide reductase [Bacteroidetes bacterium]|nr:MAG: polysulfide reductase [Bacteroidota bacterium]
MIIENQKSISTIENDLLSSVNWSRNFKLWMGLLIVSLIVCLYFYFLQLRDGLSVTGLGDFVSWGLYISNFVFFVAASLIGMLITSVMGLLNIKWITPIARIAEILAIGFAMVAGLIIITDMGRPDRLHHVFMFGRVQSPIVWDIAIVITYVAISLMLYYIPLIPDIALCNKKLIGLSKFQRRIYKVLSFGWADKPEQFELIHKFSKILMVLIIPIAISIHTVTSWLFAMTLRAGWDSSIFGPYFVAGAFVAGCAAIIIAMYVFRTAFNLKDYITDMHFDKMGQLFVLVSLVYVYFNINEIIVPAYKLREGEATHLMSMLTGHNSFMFWLVQIGGLLIPFILLLFNKMRKPLPIMLISIVVLVAAWFKRYLIVVPIQEHPYMPIQNVPEKFMHYSPTTAEIAITVASFIIFLIIVSFLAKLFPVIPVWEVKNELGHKNNS